ncbi:MAG: response regulator [Pseudorhodoplanes sp.]|nr:response regulator [Pseudorhodoplanes sp.]
MRVLIVEDEALLALHLQECVEEAGHTVVGIAATSREALELAANANPDLAFVDIHLLDGTTGITVAQQLVHQCKTLVVFMTANQKLIPGDFAGAAGVVSKPYTQSGLMSALRFIERCMNTRTASGRPPSSLTLSKNYQERWHVPP